MYKNYIILSSAYSYLISELGNPKEFLSTSKVYSMHSQVHMQNTPFIIWYQIWVILRKNWVDSEVYLHLLSLSFLIIANIPLSTLIFNIVRLVGQWRQ